MTRLKTAARETKVLVTGSKIVILGMKGIFFCRGRKITKFDFLYVQRHFVGLKPFVDVAKLAINKRLEFL